MTTLKVVPKISDPDLQKDRKRSVPPAAAIPDIKPSDLMAPEAEEEGEPAVDLEAQTSKAQGLKNKVKGVFASAKSNYILVIIVVISILVIGIVAYFLSKKSKASKKSRAGGATNSPATTPPTPPTPPSPSTTPTPPAIETPVETPTASNTTLADSTPQTATPQAAHTDISHENIMMMSPEKLNEMRRSMIENTSDEAEDETDETEETKETKDHIPVAPTTPTVSTPSTTESPSLHMSPTRFEPVVDKPDTQNDVSTLVTYNDVSTLVTHSDISTSATAITQPSGICTKILASGRYCKNKVEPGAELCRMHK